MVPILYSDMLCFARMYLVFLPLSFYFLITAQQQCKHAQPVNPFAVFGVMLGCLISCVSDRYQETIFLSDGSLWAGKGKTAGRAGFPPSPDRCPYGTLLMLGCCSIRSQVRTLKWGWLLLLLLHLSQRCRLQFERCFVNTIIRL